MLVLLSAALGCATVPRTDRDLFEAIKQDNAAEVERRVATGANVNVKADRSYDTLPPLGRPACGARQRPPSFRRARRQRQRWKPGRQHAAARRPYNRQPAMVALLVRKGGNVNARTAIGYTPLHKAMEQLAMAPANQTPTGEEVATVINIVGLLLGSGAAVNARAPRSACPFTWPRSAGQNQLVQLLIEKGADVNARSSDGQTPLYQAAKKDSPDVATLLLAHKADVNARTKSGYTALMASARDGNPGTAEVLLAHGADVGARNKDGATALAFGVPVASAPLHAGSLDARGKRRATEGGGLG